MSIYDSVDNYAKELNMNIEQAKIRLNYFSKIKKEIYESSKCPKCGKHTLKFEGGEWESCIADYIYCENDKIEIIDDEGDTFYDDCDFTDDVKSEYLFAFHLDFDPILMMSCEVDINDDQAVEKRIGSSWSEFVNKYTKILIK